MRKFKVVKMWPGGPGVGSELVVGGAEERYCWKNGYPGVYPVNELEGFVEEIKKPEEFWVLDRAGSPMPSTLDTLFNIVPDWLRFRTKESAEKFAKALKELHGQDIACAVIADDAEQGDLLINVINALNDRVK